MPANESISSGMRGNYQRRMLEVRGAFEAGGASGAVTIAARAAAVDELVRELWRQAVERDPRMGAGVALVAVGGYGRRELFPYSDVDLLFLLDGRLAEKEVKDAIRRVNQEMWDCGMRVSPVTRKLAECERLDPENAEWVLSLMDHRMVAGDVGLYDKLAGQCVPKLLQREHKNVMVRLLELTRARHAKYGDTLFHLEPNIKDCPGGLRDVHVCGWMTKLREVAAQEKMSGTTIRWTGRPRMLRRRRWWGWLGANRRRRMRRTGCGFISVMHGAWNGACRRCWTRCRRGRRPRSCWE